MNRKIDSIKFISKLSALGQRQLNNEKKALGIIKAELKKFGIIFSEQKYITYIPKVLKEKLVVDGIEIPAKATSFVSGKISSKSAIVSSLISSQKFLYEPNINFNPQCQAISKSNHYFAPSLAISKNSLPLLLTATKIQGEVKVQKIAHQSSNVLVGNLKNPRNIIFCHYDSIGPGACDNAAGCAVVINMILADKGAESENLYVIAGNEELSYDQGIYWGHGYRVFQQKYNKLLLKADKLVVVDSVGQSKTVVTQNPAIVKLGFPLKNMEKYSKKTYMISGGLSELMDIYHSDLDLVSGIKSAFLSEAEQIALKLIS